MYEDTDTNGLKSVPAGTGKHIMNIPYINKDHQRTKAFICEDCYLLTVVSH
jgi:hypothetical protein